MRSLWRSLKYTLLQRLPQHAMRATRCVEKGDAMKRNNTEFQFSTRVASGHAVCTGDAVDATATRRASNDGSESRTPRPEPRIVQSAPTLPSVADAILQTVKRDVNAVASFCIIWPSEFAFVVQSMHGAHVGSSELFSVPRSELLSAFGIDGLNTRSLSTSWQIEHLPASLHRAPFLVPGTTKLTLPIGLGGYLLGIVGMALPYKLNTTERAWYGNVCAAVGGSEGTEDHPETIDAELVRPHADAIGWGAASEKVLSPREREIARYLAEGYSTINIGAILGVSPNTVRTYVRRVYTKLNVCSRVELVLRIR